MEASLKEIVHFRLGWLLQKDLEHLKVEWQRTVPSVKIETVPVQGLFWVSIQSRDRLQLKQLEMDIRKQLRPFLFEGTEQGIEEAIQAMCIGQKKMLACAESCTGGAITSRLLRKPGASHYFLGSIIAYSNRMKQELLKIDEKILRKFGAVSFETVQAMAMHMLAKSGADIAIATSGIAGPSGGSVDKPVGTVWISIVEKNKIPHTFSLALQGDRESIIDDAANKALFALWHCLHYEQVFLDFG